MFFWMLRLSISTKTFVGFSYHSNYSSEAEAGKKRSGVPEAQAVLLGSFVRGVRDSVTMSGQKEERTARLIRAINENSLFFLAFVSFD